MRRLLLLIFLSTSGLHAADVPDDSAVLSAWQDDSVFETAYANAVKAELLDAVMQKAAKTHAMGMGEQHAIPYALLLERMGRLEDARKVLRSVEGYGSAWHLARLGDPAPLHRTASQWIPGDPLAAALTPLVSDPDAARRGVSRALLETQMAEFPEPIVQGPLMCALAEFAFQEERLEQFIVEAEARAENLAEGCLAVSRLHGYLFDGKKRDAWLLKSVEKPGRTPAWWSALVQFISRDYHHASAHGLNPPSGMDALIGRLLREPEIPREVRSRMLCDWFNSSPGPFLSWMESHPGDLERAAGVLILRGLGLIPAPLRSLIIASARRLPDRLEIQLAALISLRQESRDDEARAAAEALFHAAVQQWRGAGEGQPDSLLRTFDRIQPQSDIAGDGWQPLPVANLAAFVRSRAWKEWRALAGNSKMMSTINGTFHLRQNNFIQAPKIPLHFSNPSNSFLPLVISSSNLARCVRIFFAEP